MPIKCHPFTVGAACVRMEEIGQKMGRKPSRQEAGKPEFEAEGDAFVSRVV